MSFSRTMSSLFLASQLSACALEASDASHEAPEPSAAASATARLQAPPTLAFPTVLQIRDTTKNDGPTVVYTREGFIFRLSLTRTGASLSMENAGDALVRIGSFRLTADCEGGWTDWGSPGVAPGVPTNAEARCRDGAVPSVASVEIRTLASSASDIGYRLPRHLPPGGAQFSFSGFPTELYAGDGSSASMLRVDANAIAGVFTNRTTAAVGARIVLEGACPEARFDEPLIDDTGAQRVLPGATLGAVVRCLNGVPTPTLSVRTWPWTAALAATPEVTNVAL